MKEYLGKEVKVKIDRHLGFRHPEYGFYNRLKPIGHSSPDGRDEKLYKDLSELTTAKNIVKSITIEVK